MSRPRFDWPDADAVQFISLWKRYLNDSAPLSPLEALRLRRLTGRRRRISRRENGPYKAMRRQLRLPGWKRDRMR